MYAAFNGQVESMKTLLDAGADVNARGKNGWKNGMTALMFAAVSGTPESVKLLLSARCGWASMPGVMMVISH